MSFHPDRLGPLLASGARADVYEWNDGSDEPRVVKVYRGDSSRRRAYGLLAALGLADHAHLIRLVGVVDVEGVDVGVVGVGAVGVGAARVDAVGVVLPRLSTRTAAGWLTERRMISSGECVTLLVPILLALLHLERRRLDARVVVDAAIGLDDVLFDERGAAVVTGVRLRAPTPGAEAANGLHATACRLVAEVLARTVGGGAAARAGLVALCEQEGQIDELLEALFDLDEPAALEEPHPFVPPAADTPTPGSPGPSSHRVPGRLLGSVSTRRMRTAFAALREVRPKVWAATGVLAVSAIVGLSVVSGSAAAPGAGSAAAPATPGPNDAMTSAAVAPAATAPATASLGAATPGSAAYTSRVPGKPAASPAAATAQILHGDDADAAARELLRLRAACLAALDKDCLAGVDQPGSPVLTSDLAAVGDPALLERLPVTLTISRVVNRLGGAGLYIATGASHEPATVLITRSDAGWRLRSIS